MLYRSEADDILPEDLEAAGQAYDVMAAEGWDGWERRQNEAVEWLRSRPGIREAVRRSIEEAGEFPEFTIELSEPALHYEIGKRWPEAEIDEDFQLCEEPEAVAGEMVKNVIQDGEVVARIYTIEEEED